MHVEGLGLLGPGLQDWDSVARIFRGESTHAPAPTVLPAPARLPPAERRRAGAAVKLALAVADQAVAAAGLDPSSLATVFTSSSGEGMNCHALCETLASDSPLISPTRFTNSVHNAPAGCWHIAVGSRASSTSLCGFDGSFAAGLLEAAGIVAATGQAVLLVASDSPYPEPLHAKRPLPDHFGLAMVLAPRPGPRTMGALSLSLVRDAGESPAPVSWPPSLESLRHDIPAACAIPLLAALAQPGSVARVLIDYLGTMRLSVALL